MPMRLLAAAILVLGFQAHLDRAGAANWPNWRGPTQNGVSTETGVPTRWTRTKNVAWRLALPGPAGATPVVWDGPPSTGRTCS